MIKENLKKYMFSQRDEIAEEVDFNIIKYNKTLALFNKNKDDLKKIDNQIRLLNNFYPDDNMIADDFDMLRKEKDFCIVKIKELEVNLIFERTKLDLSIQKLIRFNIDINWLDRKEDDDE